MRNIEENIILFCFVCCLSPFLKVKTYTQSDGRRRKKNCKISKHYFFMFWFAHAQQFSKVDSPAEMALSYEQVIFKLWIKAVKMLFRLKNRRAGPT